MKWADASVRIQDWLTEHSWVFATGIASCTAGDMDSMYLHSLTLQREIFKFAFYCHKILLHCFDVCQPEMSSTHKSPHVLMTFNPSESIATEVFRNFSIFCRAKNKKQIFLTTTAGFLGREGKKRRRRGTGSIPSHQEVGAAVFW